jgi:hypothetical protein
MPDPTSSLAMDTTKAVRHKQRLIQSHDATLPAIPHSTSNTTAPAEQPKTQPAAAPYPAPTANHTSLHHSTSSLPHRTTLPLTPNPKQHRSLRVTTW